MKPYISKELGQISFYLGGFFLVSALPISALFFLASIFIAFFNKEEIQYNNKYNYVLLICSLLMISKNIFFNLPINLSDQNIRANMWLDLLNWIPFFLIFISFQLYLRNTNQRINFSRFLIAGSIPLFISCILQSWFKVYGPFETLNGLIVWFQKPVEQNHFGITGLFNNQNYTGLWLTAILPFLIAEIKFTKYKLFIYFLLFCDVYLLFLTTSKNAFLGFLTIIIMLYGLRSKIFNLISIFCCSCFLFLKIFNNIDFQKINFIPFQIYDEIISFNFFNSSRFETIKITSSLISKRPIWGWGKSLYSNLFISNGGNYNIEHSHSIPLEIAFNYGIPVSLLLVTFTALLIIKSWIKINHFKIKDNNDFFNKCWILSLITIAASHLNDITYYDGKISLLVWILLTGSKCIINNYDGDLRFEKKSKID